MLEYTRDPTGIENTMLCSCDKPNAWHVALHLMEALVWRQNLQKPYNLILVSPPQTYRITHLKQLLMPEHEFCLNKLPFHESHKIFSSSSTAVGE
jgi:hypothetical protein